MNIGKTIKALRKERGIRQIEMCKSLGVTQPYLSQIETGAKIPSAKVIGYICFLLRVPVPVLYWMSIEESDLGIDKTEVYRLLKPTIDEMINRLV